MRRTVPPSAVIEEQIDELLGVGVGDNPRESLSELARLGARLIIQRAVEDEFDAWLGRARYERRPGYQRGLRNPTQDFATVFARAGCRRSRGSYGRDPAGPGGRRAVRLQAVSVQHEGLAHRAAAGDGDRRVRRGLSMRDIESLCEKAGLGTLSKSTAPRICQRAQGTFKAFKRRDLYEVQLAALFLRRGLYRSVPTGPRRACWSPGASPKQASGCSRGDARDARVTRGLA